MVANCCHSAASHATRMSDGNAVTPISSSMVQAHQREGYGLGQCVILCNIVKLSFLWSTQSNFILFFWFDVSFLIQERQMKAEKKKTLKLFLLQSSTV